MLLFKKKKKAYLGLPVLNLLRPFISIDAFRVLRPELEIRGTLVPSINSRSRSELPKLTMKSRLDLPATGTYVSLLWVHVESTSRLQHCLLQAVVQI